MNSNLYKSIHSISKFAGIIKISIPLLNDMHDFIAASLCNELSKSPSTIQPEIDAISSNSNNYSKLFNLSNYNFYDLKFIPNLSVAAKFVPQYDPPFPAQYSPNSIISLLKSNLPPSLISASINPNNPIASIIVYQNPSPPPSIKILHRQINDIKADIYHELQHLSQDLIAIAKKLKSFPGLPSSHIIDPIFNPEGAQIAHGPIPYNVVLDQYNHINHELRDVEFYPSIYDNIHEFNKYVPLLPPPLHHPYMLLWINHISPNSFIHKALSINLPNHIINDALSPITSNFLNEFFISLSNNQPKKYRKACAEFSKILNL